MCVAEIATGIVMAATFHTSEQTSPLGSGSPMDSNPACQLFYSLILPSSNEAVSEVLQ